MTWNECKKYGLAVPTPNGTNVKLFYDQYSFQMAGTPAGMIVESAVWQGDFLQVRGRDSHGTPKIILMDGFHSWRPVHF